MSVMKIEFLLRNSRGFKYSTYIPQKSSRSSEPFWQSSSPSQRKEFGTQAFETLPKEEHANWVGLH